MLSAVIACLSVVFFVWLGLFLQPGQDSYGMGRFLLLVCVAGSFLGVIPAQIVVWRYRQAFKNVDDAA